MVFHPAFRRGRELEQQNLGEKHWPCWNGDASRLFVRKAGFNYGWDWGPVLMTGALFFLFCIAFSAAFSIDELLPSAGPYRPIHLEIYNSRISDLFVSSLDGTIP